MLRVFAILAMSASQAWATPRIFRGFQAAYPPEQYPNVTKLVEIKCLICHETLRNGKRSNRRNYYGFDLETKDFDFKAIERLDSDGDGFRNIDEIRAGTLPGDKTSFPGVRSKTGDR